MSASAILDFITYGSKLIKFLQISQETYCEESKILEKDRTNQMALTVKA